MCSHKNYPTSRLMMSFRVRVSPKEGFPLVASLSTAAMVKNPSSLRANTSSGPSEERKGLLSGIDTPSISDADTSKPSSLCDRSTCLPVTVIGVLLGLILSASYWLHTPPHMINSLRFDGQSLLSNGTQEFKRTVVLVSIDGLRHAFQSKSSSDTTNATHRADYLDRGLTPHLLDVSKKGLRAKFMKPVFPVGAAL
jgi:hypothetical protein